MFTLEIIDPTNYLFPLMLILVVEIDKFMSKDYSTKRLVKLALVFAIVILSIYFCSNIYFNKYLILNKFNFNLKLYLKILLNFQV